MPNTLFIGLFFKIQTTFKVWFKAISHDLSINDKKYEKIVYFIIN